MNEKLLNSCRQFFNKSDLFSKVMLLTIAIGIWAIFVQNTIHHNTSQDVYVINTVDTRVENTVDVDVNSIGEVDVNVEHWNGWLVGSHHGYTDDRGKKHVAIDVYKNGGW